MTRILLLIGFGIIIYLEIKIMAHLQEVEAKLDALHEKGDEVVAEFRKTLQEIKDHVHEPEVIARILAKADAQLADYQGILDEAKPPVEPTE